MSDHKYVYLNLQEQVGKNKKDIEDLRRATAKLVNARIVGQEASEADLPDPLTYPGQLGDAYLIGNEEPYDLYIYVEPAAGQTAFRWLDAGAYPAPGPQGPQGPQGEQGERGDASNWRFGNTNPSVLDTDKDNDGYLNTSTGMVYAFADGRWWAIGSIKGAAGPQGPQGPQGGIGPQGQAGPQGVQGPAGMTVQVIDTVASPGSLPDPDDVPRNAGYIVDDGNTQQLYIIVGEEGDLSWHNAGAFADVPGTSAGFGVVAATFTALSPSSSPYVTVETDGPDSAKNMTFHFGIPVGANLENANAAIPSTQKGYTQYVIDKRTMKQLIKSPAEIGVSTPANLADVISAMPNLTEAVFGSSFMRNEDLPKESGISVQGMFHIVKSGLGQYSVEYYADNYNVYTYYGSSGTPSAAVWRRLATIGSTNTTNVPSGGTTGQILAKASDLDYDTEWEDAPREVPNGGTTGQVLAKASDDDGDLEWKTPTPGLPSGGASGQMLAKRSNDNYDAEWQTAPVGVPSGGSSAQVLRKSSGADYAMEWATVAGIPSGGYSGQILGKKSNDNYDVEWMTPSGGGGASLIKLSENLLINPFFNINQRGSSSWGVGTASYMCDRWYKYSAGSITRSTPSVGQAYVMNVIQAKMCQFIEGPGNSAAKLLVVIDANESNHTLSANPIYGRYKDGLGSWQTMSPIDSGSKAQGGGETSNHKQYFAVFEQSSFAQIYEIGVDLTAEDQGANAVGFTKAGCYMIYNWDSDLKDLLFGASGNGISVALPDYGTDLEKCKYYYQYIYNNQYGRDPITLYIAYSGGQITTKKFSHQIKLGKMRVTPTIDSSSRHYITYYTTTVAYSTQGIGTLRNENNEYASIYQQSNNVDDMPNAIGGYGQSNYIADAEIYP